MSTDEWGHVGYILIFAGMFLLGRKAKLGWVSRFLGDGVWCGVGMAMGMSSIWLWGLAFMVNDVLSYRRWDKKGAPEGERIIVGVVLHEGDSALDIARTIAATDDLTEKEKADLSKTIIANVGHNGI